MCSCDFAYHLSRHHFIQSCLNKGKIAITFVSWGKIYTTKYFGSCATECTFSDLDWISESRIFNFRIRIAYGVYEKISDPIRLQNFDIRTPLLGSQNGKFAPIFIITEAKTHSFLFVQTNWVCPSEAQKFLKITLVRVSDCDSSRVNIFTIFGDSTRVKFSDWLEFRCHCNIDLFSSDSRLKKWGPLRGERKSRGRPTSMSLL